EVVVSDTGLVSIMGGKWTTYRQMAEDTMVHAVAVGDLGESPCVTADLHLHGWIDRDDPSMPTDHVRRQYGSDASALDELAAEEPRLGEPVHERLPYRGAEFAWAARHEMALTLEDAMARRTRALLLDASASIEAAPLVASIMATELGHDEAWEADQVREFGELAGGYQLLS
ncbi:MAG: glycerol-3-phosphate dehydrogenase C-terminal domain-containing protein, partial [Planctomycetota bacterium]|nr:glycerol-3-phosphate dehydrogenase C-terminal domain-containing protein [Planctomycetota bacterium]